MDKQTYLSKFSRAVRWRLPPSEAAEVLADYREILASRSGSDDTLVQELGEPLQAARLLDAGGQYRRWLLVFGALALCLLLPEFLLLRGRFGQIIPERLIVFLQLAGTAGALLWFRPTGRGEKRPPLPKGLAPAMALLLAAVLAAGGVLWGLASGAWEALPAYHYGRVSSWVLYLAGAAGMAAGLWGLVGARMSDRRWRALYVLGLAALAECTLVMALLASMSLDTAVAGWWVEYAVRWAVVGAVGLVGTGVALC